MNPRHTCPDSDKDYGCSCAQAAMTIQEYWAAVMRYLLDNPEQRLGQAAFNVLADARPDLSEQIRGTALDAFYVPTRFIAMCKWIATHW